MEQTYGYARVSSVDQNAERQLQALLAYGIAEENIVIDKQSGKDTNREQYLGLRNWRLREGDTLVIKELDRLSRNKADIKQELEYFRQRKIRVVILDIPTTRLSFSEEQSWVGDMVNNILIEVLSSMAEEERLKIRKRQREGIDAAQHNGVKFGRPRAKLPSNWQGVMERVVAGTLQPIEAMRELHLKRSTYYKFCREYEIVRKDDSGHDK